MVFVLVNIFLCHHMTLGFALQANALNGHHKSFVCVRLGGAGKIAYG